MNNYNLTFIKDEDLYNHVKDTINRYRFNIDLKQLIFNIKKPTI